eukprot:TRINITY_DN4184_c0_g1_i2.p1 TRINITY_DN4184_c0_g1~~TRINITY_DN4184_c0_g1_i2.p1  ORF type:complete len:105 (-),score=2.98 TRINITY_DN4184_c0_g1_i2:76-390(-)
MFFSRFKKENRGRCVQDDELICGTWLLLEYEIYQKMHLFYQEKKGVEHLARLVDEVISGEHIPLFKIKPKTELRSIKKHNRLTKKRTIFTTAACEYTVANQMNM